MPRFRPWPTVGLIATWAAAGLAIAAAPPPPAPTASPVNEKCFEHAGLKTTLTIKLHATAAEQIAGVFESASNQEDDAATQIFPFVGSRDKAAPATSYGIQFTDKGRPQPLRKHHKITWKLLSHGPSESLVVNLYGEKLDGKKPASFMFYDVEFLPCIGPATPPAAAAPLH